MNPAVLAMLCSLFFNDLGEPLESMETCIGIHTEKSNGRIVEIRFIYEEDIEDLFEDDEIVLESINEEDCSCDSNTAMYKVQ